MVRFRAQWSGLAVASVLLTPRVAPARGRPDVDAGAGRSASSADRSCCAGPFDGPSSDPAVASALRPPRAGGAAARLPPGERVAQSERKHRGDGDEREPFGRSRALRVRLVRTDRDRERSTRRDRAPGERRLVRDADRRGQLRRARAPAGGHVRGRHPHEGRRDGGALPAVLPLLGPGGERDRGPQPLRAGQLRRLDDVDRLADVPRRRHLPPRLVAARQPEHRRRWLRAEAPQRHHRRRARGHAAARQCLPVRADPRSSPRTA